MVYDTIALPSADARLWEVEAATERVWMTDEGRAFFGLTPDEVLTLDRVASFIHPEDRGAWRQSVREALKSGQAVHVEFRVARPDGSIRWFVSQGRSHIRRDGEPPCLMGVSIDVTDRKHAEERLRTSEALSAGVLASLPGHMVIDDRSGAILRTSDLWQEFAAGEGALDPTVLAVGTGQPQTHPRAAEQAGPGGKEIQGGIDGVLAGTHAEFRLDYAYPTRSEERWASASVLPLQRPERGAVIYRQDIIGQSVWVGVGGDPVKGVRFADLVPFYAADAQTEAVLIIGEIGGAEEEEFAQAVRVHGFTKPTFALIAG